MHTRIKLVVGSIVSGILVHLIVTGCSDGTSRVQPLFGATVKTANADNDDLNRSISADTDLTRLRGGFQTAGAGVQRITDGPFVLTDVTVLPGQSNQRTIFFSATGNTCPDLNGDTIPVADVVVMVPNILSPVLMNGAHYPVPAGRILCAWSTDGNQGYSWAGFAPYH